MSRLPSDKAVRERARSTRSTSRSWRSWRGGARRLCVALLLNHPMARWSGFRILLLLPWAIAPVANAVLWKWISTPTTASSTRILRRTRDHRPQYRSGSATPFSALNMILHRRCLEVDAVHRHAAAGRRCRTSRDRSTAPPVWTARGRWQQLPLHHAAVAQDGARRSRSCCRRSGRCGSSISSSC